MKMCYSLFCSFLMKGCVVMPADKNGFKTIAENRKARHDYFVIESYEAGIELVGTEVKAIRQGGVNLKDSWCTIEDGELWVKGMHISPYEHGNIFNRDPMRVRRLLLHKKEINKLSVLSSRRGLLSFLSLFTSRVQGSRCRSVFARARSFTISVMQWLPRLPSVILTEPSRRETGKTFAS